MWKYYGNCSLSSVVQQLRGAGSRTATGSLRKCLPHAEANGDCPRNTAELLYLARKRFSDGKEKRGRS